MRTRRRGVLSTTVLVAALVGACGPGGGSGPGGADEPPPSAAAERPAPTTADEATGDDDAACTVFGDVLTIVENADVALAEGRMAAQEQHGWYQLATRVLGRIPADGGTDVQAAIGALQAAAPAVPSGAFAESTGVGSPAWSHAVNDLGTACDAVGAPLAISAFTGG
ncbi:hypothetical protein [Cellulomonas sp. PS-H5]|uniref:hypothetical protein n=1 Tax=Cellulomonas sp. PS-H5 TaxID=2820400 RepID=UPI001C4FA25B|nr:hypothetical protein [Cellulomonas sp. PS-H5]MBW0252690.1 hypothetical protein [Cellulomonas sp. PS-H5]